MNHKMGFNPLSRTTAHRRAMLRNMVTSLFRYERITTTKAKALEVRRFAEKLITRGKVDSVHNRRQAARFIQDEIILAKLFKDIGPRMQDRNGGYTRIMKLGFRQGDAADMAILELVDYKLDTGKSSDKKAEKAKKDDTAASTAEKTPAKKASAKKAAGTSAKKASGTAAKKPAAKKTAKAAPAKEESAPAENKE
ncbi:MAG: 50S ribosomal protein L17 [Treponemataceae bacterium]|nr:50S ribosomal protein L17 [Treponemataceae bacterium]